LRIKKDIPDSWDDHSVVKISLGDWAKKIPWRV
jgi:hypothetical protein